MGYESRIHVVVETDLGNKIFADELGSIDLCKCPLGCFKEEARGRLFSTEGDYITEDKYGDPITAAPIDDVIKAIDEVIAKTDYRRAKIAKAFLESARENISDLMVYHYGH